MSYMSDDEANRVHDLGIERIFPRTCPESHEDLLDRLRGARERISLFGLTRNFYSSAELLTILSKKASHIPVRLYVMEPHCDSRQDRYRLEPTTANWADPDIYIEKVIGPLSSIANIQLFTFNFPCSFALEEIDRTCRIMLYGHGVRGTDSPIMVLSDSSECYAYFSSQIRWLEGLSNSSAGGYWERKGIVVRRYRSDC
jgi:hypothetical protein